MARDLTTSQVDRQNILNNENAVAEIQNQTGLQGIIFEERLCFTKAMVASFSRWKFGLLNAMLVKILRKSLRMDTKSLKEKD